MTARAPDVTYNDYFPTETVARLFWAVWHLALYGLEAPIRLFPGDRPISVQSGQPARGAEIFDALRQVDLYAWTGRFTDLRSVGPGRWKGRCPLHEEQTASFYIYSDPWRWRCYGACAMGGDVTALARELRLRGKW